MAQTSVQYTPVQVLQAARRAEAEGKMDYALQFYRHIVEHHGTSVEAQEAREGLFRIAEWRWGEARIARRQEATASNGFGGQGGHAAQAGHQGNNQGGHQGSHQGHQGGHQGSHQGHQGGHQGGHGGPRQAAAASAQAAQQQAYAPEPADQSTPMTGGVTKLPQIIAREAAAKAAEANNVEEHVPFKARYRAATFAAQLVSGCGWASALGGLLVVALAFADIAADVSAVALLGLPLGVVLGIPATVIGLVLIVTGSLAIAVFDNTNATLEHLSTRRRRAG